MGAPATGRAPAAALLQRAGSRRRRPMALWFGAGTRGEFAGQALGLSPCRTGPTQVPQDPGASMVASDPTTCPSGSNACRTSFRRRPGRRSRRGLPVPRRTMSIPPIPERARGPGTGILGSPIPSDSGGDSRQRVTLASRPESALDRRCIRANLDADPLGAAAVTAVPARCAAWWWGSTWEQSCRTGSAARCASGYRWPPVPVRGGAHARGGS